MANIEGSCLKSCKTVLVVDDDTMVLKALGRILAEMDLCLLTAESAAAALALCQDQEVAVLISDHRMSGATGVELLKEMQVLNPATIRILMTGDSDCREIYEAVNQGLIDKVLNKPWEFKELIAIVTHGLDQYHNSTRGQGSEGRSH